MSVWLSERAERARVRLLVELFVWLLAPQLERQDTKR
jgi:hypothetical protein